MVCRGVRGDRDARVAPTAPFGGEKAVPRGENGFPSHPAMYLVFAF